MRLDPVFCIQSHLSEGSMIAAGDGDGGPRLRRLAVRPAKSTLARTAYESLRALILTGELPSGTRLTEIELALRLKVSRTPLREALNRLARDGLVIHESHRGYAVAEFDLKYFEDAFGMREALDGYAALQATLHIGGADRDELQSLVRRCEELARGRDRSLESLIEEMQLGLEVHRVIARASGNRMLAETLREILDRCQYFVWLELLWLDEWAAARREHAAIVEAICRGDGERAAVLAGDHVRGSKNNVLRFLRAKSAYRQFIAGGMEPHRRGRAEIPRRRSA
jgi:DNA-binding GntR family transcriptional regulator